MPTRSCRQPWGTKSPKRMTRPYDLFPAPPADRVAVPVRHTASAAVDGRRPRRPPTGGYPPPMRMTVIGCGYLGAVHAPCMAELGHDVIGVDLDEVKVKELAAGRAPFYEPGLPELLERAGASGRLRFTTDVADVARAPGGTPDESAPTVHFICVGPPQRKAEFAAHSSYVDQALANLLPYLRPGDLVVG